MKNTLKAFIALFVLLAFASVGFAQTATTRTTLSTAISTVGGSTETLTVASTTGMSASTNTAQNYLLIDAELMRVTAVPSSTTVTVTRAYQGTSSKHAAGAEVRYGVGGGRWDPATGNTTGVFLSGGAFPTGSCTRASNRFLPVFHIQGSVVTAFDCPNSVSTTTGVWQPWQYFPKTSEVGAIQTLPCQAGSTTACTSYTALVSDYIIVVSTEFTPDNATFTITLPCSSVPAGKVWIVTYTGLGAGTTGNGVSIIGANNTQQILTGITGRAFVSDGTNCARLSN